MLKRSCPCDNLKILSPCVGAFYPAQDPSPSHIGILRQLSTSITLTCSPVPNAVLKPLLNAPSLIQAGTAVAQWFPSSAPTPTDRPQPEILSILSPADGFISFCDSRRNPLCSPGDKLVRGSPIAILEFMKIRIEINFPHPAPAIFHQYIQTTPRAVKKGEPIAQFYYPSRQTDPDQEI